MRDTSANPIYLPENPIIPLAMRWLACALLLLPCCLIAQDYFQQDVAYAIEVTLDDDAHFLRGNVALTYTNNSPDVLDVIHMHVWPNAYKNGKTALAQQQYRNGNMFMFYALAKELGYMDSLDFKVNGLPTNWSLDETHIDIAHVPLPEPLQPGASLKMTTPFRVKLPTGRISRLGHIGQSYQITQWYPKPAVYDRDGWHAMPYLNQGEFYSEFGSFDVSITLPENYVVGATGDLTNCPEELAFLDSLSVETSRLTSFPASTEFPPSAPRTKTLHYHQENVHDFAWFADKRYYVLKGEVELPHSKRKVTSWAMFTSGEGELWKNAIEYINDGTYYYSLWNGDYPYNQVTAVDGTISAGGGMEYPNVTVIGRSGSALGLETVIVHEVGHNWFYGILGSNERVNAWMDEGVNSYNETRYMVEKYGDSLSLTSGMFDPKVAELLDATKYTYASRDEFAYLLSARGYNDQPMQCHSDTFTRINYGTVVYKKTAVALEHLAGALGQATFDRGMQAYFDMWQFRHPNPQDLQDVLESTSGEDLDWWFKDMVQSSGKPDYSVRKARFEAGQLEVKIRNTGDIPSDFQVGGLDSDGNEIVAEWFPGIAPGEDTTVVLSPTDGGAIARVVLDSNEEMLEFDRKNNAARTSGLFRRTEPLQVRMLSRLDDPDRTQLFWLPLYAWNEQDKNMVGFGLHNATLPQRDVEWSLMPMYSFHTNRVNGFGRLALHRGRNLLEVTSRRFTDWNNGVEVFQQNGSRFESSDRWYWRNAIALTHQGPVRSGQVPWSIGLELVHVYDRLDLDISGVDGPGGTSFQDFNNRLAPRAFFEWSQKRTLTKHAINTDVRGLFDAPAPDEVRYDGMRAQVTYDGTRQYNQKGKQISWRVFAAVAESGVYDLPLSASGLTGQNDVMRDVLFLQRFNTNSGLAQQVNNDQAGLGLPALADTYLVSGKVEWQTPRLPLSLYGGAFVGDGATDFDYVTGVKLRLGFFAVNLPLASTDILEGPYDPGTTVTFELHLEGLRPWNILRNLQI